MNKFIFFVLLNLFYFQKLHAQSQVFLEYPNTQPTLPDKYFSCNFYGCVQTKDKGFVLSYMPYAPNLHEPFPVDYITLKTDSNFVPIWKKPNFYMSIPLPTGGIILINCFGPTTVNSPLYAPTIEKITASGQLVWQKKIGTSDPEFVFISDAVSYNNKITLVGSHSYFSLMQVGNFSHSALFTLDTNGTVLAKAEYTSVNPIRLEHMIRDNSGNFIVSGTNSLSKFDASLNPVWSWGWSDIYPPGISDIKLLSNGDLFCTGGVRDSTTTYNAGAFLKFNSSGSFLFEKHFPASPGSAGNITRLPNGKFLVNYREGFQTYQDSMTVLSVDSNANILWTKKYQKALDWGPGKLVKTKLCFPIYTKNPAVFTINTDGSNSCGSFAIMQTLTSGTHTQVSNSFTQITSTVPIVSTTLSPANQTQTYLNVCGSSVGLTENSMEESFSIYPNPAQDIFYIELPVINGIIKLSIYNYLGEEVRKEELYLYDQSIRLNTDDLANGVYILKIKAEQGRQLSKRLVISK